MSVHCGGVKRTENYASPSWVPLMQLGRLVGCALAAQHSTAAAFMGPLRNLIMLIAISEYWFNSLVSFKFPAILCCVQLDLISLVYL